MLTTPCSAATGSRASALPPPPAPNRVRPERYQTVPEVYASHASNTAIALQAAAAAAAVFASASACRPESQAGSNALWALADSFQKHPRAETAACRPGLQRLNDSALPGLL
ncbi:hypothetical protein C2E23DRAFT_859452 [Lenzites betulinus]|nr:hypothetical protein C2E23DRAFT_864337 [Lenzites betulinus]KAH9853172.1 hypothetical protein C2E23DRAFT_859452 [Lenzites betulinus]